MRHTNKKKRLR